MPDKTPAAKPVVLEPIPGAVVAPIRRHPGHRGADVRDTVAEMAAKAQEISMEAGSKMAAAMKDVINAAAGLTSFAIESSRDLVQYMVRRGQMTQEEADKLIREAEDSWSKKHKGKKPPARVHEPPSLKSIAKPVAVAIAAMPVHRPAPATKPAVVKHPTRKVTAPKKRPIGKKKPATGKKSAARRGPAGTKKPASKK